MHRPEIVTTDLAWRSANPLNQAIKYGDLLFVSGQLGMDPKTGKLAGPDIGSQTRQALNNLAAIIAEAGGSVDSVLKTTCYLIDMQRDSQTFNAIYAEFFKSVPARTALEVSSLGSGRLVEIEAIVGM